MRERKYVTHKSFVSPAFNFVKIHTFVLNLNLLLNYLGKWFDRVSQMDAADLQDVGR